MLGSTTKKDVRTLKLHNVGTDIKTILDLKNNEQNIRMEKISWTDHVRNFFFIY